MELTYEHLLGRPYNARNGFHCYRLVRDFFWDNFRIALNDYAIPHDWNADKLNLIEKIYEREGFVKLEEWTLKTLRPADVLCIAHRAGNANHFVINLGGNKLLHHPLGQMSRVDDMRDYFRMSTCYVVRHPDVPDLTPVKKDVSIQELLNERYRVQAEA